jgi:hypothetical protein
VTFAGRQSAAGSGNVECIVAARYDRLMDGFQPAVFGAHAPAEQQRRRDEGGKEERTLGHRSHVLG